VHFDPDCPFCPGHEDRTPPEVTRRGGGEPNGPGWEVRVFPNLYPIVDGPVAATPAAEAPHRSSPAGGGHEVVVLSPDHGRSFAHLEFREAVQVLAVLQDRSRTHFAAGRRVVQPMINHGPAGGASLAHPHAQIVAVDIASPVTAQELEQFAAGDGCVLCEEMRRLDDDASLVVARGDALLWCPWWASTAYEMLLAPRRHDARFEDSGSGVGAIARSLGQGLAHLDRHLGDPPYNLMVHTAPAPHATDYHWHIHVRPRLQVDGGFELGTGIPVNAVDPVAAAAHLREP
jgi:UDPglucose--hexose-1-phosphate uridylyltransferase